MKKLFALLALVTVAFTACNKGEEASAAKSSIVPETTVVEFTRLGGEQVVTFSIKYPQGGSVTAVESCEWMDAVVEFNSDLVITAQANEGEARESKVTLKYKHAKDVTITVKQKASGSFDVEFNVPRFEGEYYGTDYSEANNYWLFLSDKGLKTNAEGMPQYDPNGTYYYFDCYSESAPEDEEFPIIPNGTYIFDAENSCAPGTFAKNASGCKINGENLTITNGTIIVSDNKIDIQLTMSNEEKHHITYEGDLSVCKDLTTFTEDYTFDFKSASITATNYGDVYEIGMQAWFIEAVKGDNLFMLELLSASTESPAGLYTQLTGALNEGYENKFIPGFLEDGLQGTWYAKLTNETIKGDVMAPVVTGIIQVVIDESGATINFSNKDDAGFKIEGSISGKYTLNVIEEE